MKRILKIAAIVCLVLSTVMLTGCREEKVIQEASEALQQREYEEALDDILSLSDRAILGSDTLQRMLSTAYYGLAMKPMSRATYNCTDMDFTSGKDTVLLTDANLRGVKVYTYPGMKLSRTLMMPDDDEFLAIDISPDGKSIAVAMEDGSVKLMDLATENITATLPAHQIRVRDVVFLNDSVIISCSNDRSVAAWDIKNRKEIWNSYSNSRNVKNLQLSRDKTLLATASNDGSACILDPNAMGQLKQQVIHSENYVNDAAISPDNKYLVTASGDGNLILWDILDGQQLNRVVLGECISAVDISPGGSHILAGGEKNVYIVDAKSGRIVTQINTFRTPVWAAQFVNDKEIAFADNSRFWHGPLLQGQALIDAARKWQAE